MKKIFGRFAAKHIQNFRHYIFIRQQRIYRLFRVQKEDLDLRLTNIFKDRCVRYYEHVYFENENLQYYLDAGLPDPSVLVPKEPNKVFLDPKLEFEDLKDEYKTTIQEIKLICKDPSSTVHENPEDLKSMGLDHGSN